MPNTSARRTNLFDIAIAICGTILAIGVMSVFSACGAKDDGTWMFCHQVQLILALIGAIVAVAGVCRLYTRGAIRSIFGCIVIVAGILAVLLPGTILSMCMMETMRCQAIMKPFARVLGALIAICGALSLFGFGTDKDGKADK